MSTSPLTLPQKGSPSRSTLVQLSKDQLSALQRLVEQSELVASLKAGLEVALSREFEPSIAIGLEGGLVQGASTNCPMNIVVLDHDLDTNHDDHAREVYPLVDPDDCAELMSRAYDKEEASHHPTPSA